MRPEAIAAAADVPPKLSTHPDSLSTVIYMKGKIGKRGKEINSTQFSSFTTTLTVNSNWFRYGTKISWGPG